ncbi:Integrase [Minicystis rosea]|nr:Integrase [Minicystis rosea]
MKAPTTQSRPKSRGGDASAGTQPEPAPASTESKPPRRPPLSGKKKPEVKPLAGNVEPKGKFWTLRVRINGERRRLRLGALSEMSEARAHEKGAAWLERMARDGYTAEKLALETPAAPTVREHFEAWISGELYAKHGPVNGLRPKASADVDAWRAKKYLYKAPIGSKLVREVTEQDIESTIARIPDRLAGTRVKVYALLSKGFALAVFPARLRADSPVKKYHKPPKPAPKLFSYLFPAELLAVLACAAVPLGRRVFYLLAIYTGLRKSTLYSVRWSDLDLDHRTIVAKVTKNRHPQHFALPAGLVWVLRGWYTTKGRPAGTERVITRDDLGFTHPRDATKKAIRTEAQALRDDLQAAKVTRAVLFEKGPNVEPLRFHDLRSTFTTWARRAGWTDGQISDRTGHLSPEMIDRYTRAARTLEDLRIEPFPELTGTVPELAALDADRAHDRREEGSAPPSSEGSAPPSPGDSTPHSGSSALSAPEPHAHGAPSTSEPAAGGPQTWTPEGLDAANREDVPLKRPVKRRIFRRFRSDCGSSCRGFDPRYSPQVAKSIKSRGR